MRKYVYGLKTIVKVYLILIFTYISYSCMYLLYKPYNENEIEVVNSRLYNAKMGTYNKKYCKLTYGKQPVVVDLHARNYSFKSNPPMFKFYKHEPFEKMHRDDKMYNWRYISKTKQYVFEPLRTWAPTLWLNDCLSNKCDEIEFDLQHEYGIQERLSLHGHKLFNIYHGLQVDQIQDNAKCQKVLGMVKDSLCGGDIDKYNYYIKWCAHLVQKPWVKVISVPTFVGGRGVGKGMFNINVLGAFFGLGLHFLHVSDISHVTGNFNSMTGTSVFTVMDECHFRGKHDVADVMKSLCGDDIKTLTKKGIDSIQVQNYEHYIIHSNKFDCVKLESDDRNYVIIIPSNKYQNDQAYWSDVYETIHNGGKEAVLFHLMNMDIKNFNPNVIPKCFDSNRWEFKLQSLDKVDQWVLNELSKGGGVFDTSHPHMCTTSFDHKTKQNCLCKHYLYQCYKESGYYSQYNNDSAFFRKMMKCLVSTKADGDQACLQTYQPHGKSRELKIIPKKSHYSNILQKQYYYSSIDTLRLVFSEYVKTAYDDVFPDHIFHPPSKFSIIVKCVLACIKYRKKVNFKKWDVIVLCLLFIHKLRKKVTQHIDGCKRKNSDSMGSYVKKVKR